MPVTTTIDVEDVCTDQQLRDIASTAVLNRTLEAGQTGWATQRQNALLAVLTHLEARVPAVHDIDLAIPAELGRAVAYTALAEIALNATTGDGDAWSVRYRAWRDRARDETLGLRPTVEGGEAVAPAGISIPVSRR